MNKRIKKIMMGVLSIFIGILALYNLSELLTAISNFLSGSSPSFFLGMIAGNGLLLVLWCFLLYKIIKWFRK